MTDKKILNAGRRIAQIAFDGDVHQAAVHQGAATVAEHFNYFSEKGGFGVVARLDARGTTFFRERWPGAFRAALFSGDQGVVGFVLRSFYEQGWFSPSPQVHEALEYRTSKRTNAEIRKLIRAKRNTKPVRDLEAAVNDYIERSVAMLVMTADAHTMIDRDVRATPDCRDVAVDWPHRVVGGMVIPINNPHKRV